MALKQLNYRTALIISWAIALLAIILFLGPDKIIASYASFTPDNIRHQISSFGILSAIIYILSYAIRPFIFLPVTPFTIAGGFLFGTTTGLILTLIGRTILSATIAFCLSRYLFRDYVRSKIKNRYAIWDGRLEKGGIAYIAIMRMIPMLPFDMVGYIAGSSSITYKRYITGTFLGDLPGVFVLTFLGSSLLEPGSFQFYLSIILTIIVAGGSWLYIIYINKRNRDKAI